MVESFLQLLQAFSSVLQSILPDAAEQGSIKLFQDVVQWSAILLSALAGTYAARKYGMDYFGALVIAFVVCVGGGTIRDLLLGRVPVFWLKSPIYLLTVLVVSLFGLLIQQEAEKGQRLAGQISGPVQRFAGEGSLLFLVIDALALGLWAYLGTIYGLYSGVPAVLAPVLGVVTAVFGGVLRDVFFARIPQQFLPGQLYAMAATLGAIVYVLLFEAGLGGAVGFTACTAVTFAVRMASVKFNISSF